MFKNNSSKLQYTYGVPKKINLFLLKNNNYDNELSIYYVPIKIDQKIFYFI
jgi:hypothetical protein